MMKVLGLAVFAAVFIAPMSALAAPTIGVHTTDNCYPFSCFAGRGGTRYQQVYNASALSELVSFNSISFGLDESEGDRNTNGATYLISFSNTSRSSTTLSKDLASNVTGPVPKFGRYTINGQVPSIIRFIGNSFSYDPSKGNLLMDVVVTKVTSTGNGHARIIFDDSTDQMAWAYQTNFGGDRNRGGLVTTFNQTGAVPEPAVWAMMILGFGAVGLAIRRQRRAGAWANAARSLTHASFNNRNNAIRHLP